MKYIISLDCSFTRTGVSILNLDTKEFYFLTASEKIGEKQFENVVNAAKSIVNQLRSLFDTYCNGDYNIIMESPLPMSSMSSALYCLDGLIYNTFEKHMIKTYNPATLKSRIHGHKYSKTDSQELATKYLNILSNSGYTIKSDIGTKKKITHDNSDAFLYLHLYLHDSGHPDFQFDNSSEKQAYKQRLKELKKREKLLLKSSDNITI